MKEIFKGNGCQHCPAHPCIAYVYRGSTCSAIRAKAGVDFDPESSAVSNKTDLSAYPKPHPENRIVVDLSRHEWETICDALEYAVEDRMYQATCTEDPEDKETIEACAGAWNDLRNNILSCLGGPRLEEKHA